MNLFTRLSIQGVLPEHSQSFARRLTLANQINILALAIVFSYGSLFAFTGHIELAASLYVSAIVFGLGIYANSRRQYIPGRLIVCLLPHFLTLFISNTLGVDTWQYLFVFPVMMIPVAVFEPKERNYTIACILLGVVFLLLVVLEPFRVLPYKPFYEVLSDKALAGWIDYLYPINNTLTVSFCVVYIVGFLASLADQSEQKLLAQNNDLNQAKQGLEHAYEEIKAREEELVQNAEELSATNEQLSRTKTDLEHSFEDLKRAQTQLVAQEKMASLGQLVAGVAHEVNTPVGIAVTAASHLEGATDAFLRSAREGTMNKAELAKYLKIAEESSRLILKNLERASELVQSFKKVAVNQTIDETITFRLGEYVEEVMLSLKPQLRQTHITYEVRIEDTLELTSYPSVFSQMLINFTTNAIRYAFDPETPGLLVIAAHVSDGNRLVFQFSDNGKGITEEHLAKIFDPFYTTGRSLGGSGLGLNIVYNLATQKLGGQIKVDSTPGQGTTFTVICPYTAPVPALA
jgi:signal transduction histidine kinase